MHTHNPYSKCKVNRKVFKEKGGGTPGSFDRVEPFFPNAVMNLICSVPHSVKIAEFRSALRRGAKYFKPFRKIVLPGRLINDQ